MVLESKADVVAEELVGVWFGVVFAMTLVEFESAVVYFVCL